MIIGKRQIILAALILGLSVAIYLNFALANDSDLPTAGDMTSSTENYGDALFTGTDQTVIETGDDENSNAEFFAQARLTRQKMREESVIQTNGLLTSEAAQIKDIILSETNLTASDVKIVEVKK